LQIRLLAPVKREEYTPNNDCFQLDNRKPNVYVLEGEGWKRKQVFTTIEKTRLHNSFHFMAYNEGIQGCLIYWRWRPIAYNTDSPPWSDLEIILNRERNKLCYTPLPGFVYNRETGRETHPVTTKRAMLSELTDEVFEEARKAYPFWEGKNVVSLPTGTYKDPHYHQSDEEYEAHCQNIRDCSLHQEQLDIERSPTPLRWERWIQQECRRITQFKCNFRTAHPQQDQSTWGHNSQQASKFYPCNSSSVYTTPESFQPSSHTGLKARLISPLEECLTFPEPYHCCLSPDSYSGWRTTRRLLSPDLLYSLGGSECGNDTNPPESWGLPFEKFSQEEPPYKLPSASFWSAVFIDCGILEVLDIRNQSCLQCWANHDSNMVNVRDVLIKAIENRIKFWITIPNNALKHFQLLTISPRDLAAGAFYTEDFFETPLVWERGGAAFIVQWHHQVMDVLS
jgi:hypothetical protein